MSFHFHRLSHPMLPAPLVPPCWYRFSQNISLREAIVDDMDDGGLSPLQGEVCLDAGLSRCTGLRCESLANGRNGGFDVATRNEESGAVDEDSNPPDVGSDGDASTRHCLAQRVPERLVSRNLDVDLGRAVLLEQLRIAEPTEELQIRRCRLPQPLRRLILSSTDEDEGKVGNPPRDFDEHIEGFPADVRVLDGRDHEDVPPWSLARCEVCRVESEVNRDHLGATHARVSDQVLLQRFLDD